MPFLPSQLNGSLPGYWILGYRSFFLRSLEALLRCLPTVVAKGKPETIVIPTPLWDLFHLWELSRSLFIPSVPWWVFLVGTLGSFSSPKLFCIISLWSLLSSFLPFWLPVIHILDLLEFSASFLSPTFFHSLIFCPYLSGREPQLCLLVFTLSFYFCHHIFHF